MKMFPVYMFLLLLIFSGSLLWAQENLVSNVVFSVDSQKVSVYYDLSGTFDQKYNVTAKFRSKADTLNEYSVNSFEGMLGKDISTGFNNTFTWNYREDIDFVPNTTDYEFLFNVEQVNNTTNNPIGRTQNKDESKSSGGSTWYYYVGGAVVVVVALVLTVFKPADDEPEEDAIPNPPKRPF